MYLTVPSCTLKNYEDGKSYAYLTVYMHLYISIDIFTLKKVRNNYTQTNKNQEVPGSSQKSKKQLRFLEPHKCHSRELNFHERLKWLIMTQAGLISHSPRKTMFFTTECVRVRYGNASYQLLPGWESVFRISA